MLYQRFVNYDSQLYFVDYTQKTIQITNNKYSKDFGIFKIDIIQRLRFND